MNEGTNGQTNRQLARGPSGARKRPWGARDLERAWSRAITGPRQPRHYPQLSACVLRLGFRVPSGARIRARATARHRDPNVRTDLEDTEHGRKGRNGEWSTSDPLCGVCRQTRIDFTVLARCLVCTSLPTTAKATRSERSHILWQPLRIVSRFDSCVTLKYLESERKRFRLSNILESSH